MNVQNILFALIGFEIFQKEIGEQIEESITPDMLPQLYQLSKAHDVVHIVAKALSYLDKLGSDEISQKLQKAMFMAVYRYERLKYELTRIEEVFEAEKIQFIKLKGSVIRDYYPEPWLRTSCDIDILVHEEDLQRTCDCLMTKLGYTSDMEMHYHDISLFSQSGVHLELHHNIKENTPSIDGVLGQVWRHSTPVGTAKYCYAQSNEYFYFHMLAHMSYHFMHGGCGIRPFIDLLLIKRKFRFDEAYRMSLLEQGELRKFAEQAEALSEVWFDHKSHTDLTQSMEDYILSGGIYGNLENQVAVQQSKKGGKFKYVLSRIWLPLDSLKFRYPVLNKHKWLLPVCEVRRWFELLFGGRLKRTTKELEVISSLTDEKKQATKELLSRLEL